MATVAIALPCRAEAVEEARSAYREAKSAYDNGDFGLAARSFAKADELAPHERALEMALVAAQRADDPAFGMELVTRADERGLAEIARAAREAFAARTGKVDVMCPDHATCTASLDGTDLRIDKSNWATVGEHTGVLDVSGIVETFTVNVEAGQTTTVKPSAPKSEPAAAPLTTPPPSEPPPLLAKKKLSPVWFWIGTGVTGVLGAATLGSGIDTLATHDAFRADPSNERLASQGSGAEVRTNVLLVSTGVALLATAAVGWFVFRPEVTRGRANASR